MNESNTQAGLVVLETERLVLRPITEDDASFVLSLLNSPGWLRFIGDRGIRTVGAARQYIIDGPLKSYREHGFGLMMVEVKPHRVPAGLCGLLKRPGLDHPDIGFALMPAFMGRGYTTEAGAKVMEQAKQTEHISTVLAITSKDNGASGRVLEKIGLRLSGTITLPGDTEELHLYSTVAGWKKGDGDNSAL